MAEAFSRSFATNELRQILRLEASATIGIGIPPPLDDALLRTYDNYFPSDPSGAGSWIRKNSDHYSASSWIRKNSDS